MAEGRLVKITERQILGEIASESNSRRNLEKENFMKYLGEISKKMPQNMFTRKSSGKIPIEGEQIPRIYLERILTEELQVGHLEESMDELFSKAKKKSCLESERNSGKNKNIKRNSEKNFTRNTRRNYKRFMMEISD